MSELYHCVPEPSFLRVWTPDAASRDQPPPEDPHDPGTWRMFSFARRVSDQLLRQGRARETREEYLRFAKRFDEYFATWWADGPPDQKYRMGYPVIRTCGAAHLRLWREYLVSLESFSPRTINKHVATVEAILSWAADEELRDQSPHLKALPSKGAAPKFYLTLEQLSAIYQACDVAEWPTVGRRGLLGYSPADGWRAALVLWFSYGLRTQELIKHESGKRSLRCRNLVWQRETPAQEGHAESPYGWLWYVPQKQGRVKPRPLALPLSDVAAAHLRLIRCRDKRPCATLFDWPLSPDQFYPQWRRILEAAGVRPKRDPSTGQQPQYDVKHLRKTCTTHYNNHAAGIAKWITGHSSLRPDEARDSQVSDRHYDCPEQRVLRAVLSLPQPEAFRTALSRVPCLTLEARSSGKQLALF